MVLYPFLYYKKKLSSSSLIPTGGGCGAGEGSDDEKDHDSACCYDADALNGIGDLDLGIMFLGILLAAMCTYFIEEDLLRIGVALVVVAEGCDGLLLYGDYVTCGTLLTCGKTVLKTANLNTFDLYLGVAERTT